MNETQIQEVKWNKISEHTPPDTEVYIKDEYGGVGIGHATWYPFTVEKRPGDENKPYGWRGTVVPCENHWDGGWMILVTKGLTETGIEGKITEWRDIPDNEKQQEELL
jgi:hypothetical protein